jgi:hypothetical protein
VTLPGIKTGGFSIQNYLSHSISLKIVVEPSLYKKTTGIKEFPFVPVRQHAHFQGYPNDL